MVAPSEVSIRTYKVGFGDCFLVTFFYPDKNRSVLIDFGSTGLPKDAGAGRMMEIAKDIRSFVDANCGGELLAVVATHRHKDHISGFAGDTGALIEDLKPEIVLQPWTEDPVALREAKSATAGAGASLSAPKRVAGMQNHYLMALENMNEFSRAALAAAEANDRMGAANSRKIKFLADDNLANEAAVKRLARMGKKSEYVRAGDHTRLQVLLPGVKVHILGPPDLTQTETILKQRSSDKDEFWQFMRFWSLLAGAPPGGKAATPLFPRAKVIKERPMQVRWFVDRAHRLRGNQMLGIVRILDKVMNNTSVILLFETGGRKMLFPGDAQIENWAYSLSKPEVRELISDVDLYKVGHHGSTNATPKKLLWGEFKRRSKKVAGRNRLVTIVSTMHGKHGDAESGTEVPRRTLLDALKAESDFHSTENLKGKQLFEDVVVQLTQRRTAGGS